MQSDAQTSNDPVRSALEPGARRQARRITRAIIGTAVSLVLCMWGFIGWSVWSEYQVAAENGRVQGGNLTAAIAGDVSLTFDSVQAKLQLIKNNLKALPPGAEVTPEAVRLALTMPSAAHPETDMRIIGPGGELRYSSLPADAGPKFYGDQPGFVLHRDNPQVGILVEKSAPATGPDDQRITVSARLDSAGGDFAGEAMLLLKPDSLLHLNRELDIGRRGTMMIVSDGGIILAGFDREHTDGSVGRGIDLRGGPYPVSLKPGDVASYTRIGLVYGIKRLITNRRLARYPLNVAVAQDCDDIFGAPRSHTWLIAPGGLAASCLIAALTTLLVREVWRRTAREIDLAVDRDRLRAAREQIEADRQRLTEVNRELRASKDRAEAGSRAKSQFLAHMGHELRTPLHAIIGFSELIRDQASTDGRSPPLAEYAGDILASGHHLLQTINAILDIAKVESGAAKLTEAEFPLVDLVRASLGDVMNEAQQRGVAVDPPGPGCSTFIRGDRTKLQQVLVHLLSNAVKFAGHDGRIAVRTKRGAQGELLVLVEDTGIGMSAEEISVAMEPFSQVDSGLSRSYSGTGLGLTLAQRLTELHGGTLLLCSEKGHGTTATVVLPAERVC